MTDANSPRSDRLADGAPVRFGLAALLILLLLAANTTAIYLGITSGSNYAVWDFHPRWIGTRALLQGQNPYSQEVTQEIQRQLYGRLARPDEDQLAFAYPLYLVYLMIPYALLPCAWAEAAWFSSLEFALVSTILLLRRIYDWEMSPWLLALTIAWAFAFYPVTWGLILGQVAIFVTFFMALALWALRAGRDYLAGFFLAFSTLKPQMAFLLVVAVILWAVRLRRWRLVASLFFSTALLGGSVMLFVPTWPLDFWRAQGAYSRYTFFAPPIQVLADACCGTALGGILSVTITLLLLAYLFWSWWHCRDRGNTLYWTVGLTISVTSLIAPRTTIVNQVAMILPLCFIFQFLHGRPRCGWGVAVLAEFLVVAVLWLMNIVLHAAVTPTAERPFYFYEHQVMSPLLPVVLTALFWLLKRPLTGATPAT
jgi:hypothetical protein